MVAATRRPRFRTAAAAVMLCALAAAGCASDYDRSASDSSSGPSDSGRGWVGEEPGRDWGGADSEGLYKEDGAAPAADAAAGAPVTSIPVDTTTTAGSVDDNELWDAYLLYRQDFDRKGIPASKIPVEGREILTVVDDAGQPVVGADVDIAGASGNPVAHLRTYSDGRALFHAPTEVDPDTQQRSAYTATVSKDGLSTDYELSSEDDEHTITLSGATNHGAKLDVLFLVDATGSMADEIERLKANMISIAEQVQALPGTPDVRFGMTVYRDQGEAFVTRTFDFTGNVDDFTAAIGEVVADGGGDTPESLSSGLHEALTIPAWRNDDTVKLIFLVADAPPHLSGEPGYEAEPDYADDVVDAAAKGVKIFPIASSGLDDQGEYVFRQLAQITMARFVFLTYGPDGSSPGDITPHSVAPEDYDVLPLDDLVVQLVSDEVAPVGG
jgi:von Willebrand factor type A domain